MSLRQDAYVLSISGMGFVCDRAIYEVANNYVYTI